MANRQVDASPLGGVSRRRNRMLLGWFHNNPETQRLETPLSIRKIVFSIVALNVRTLAALQDGWHGPLIIDRCCDEYEKALSPEEVDLVDWLIEDGGSRFEARISEYVTLMPLTTAMDYLMDQRTSALYAQLIDISLKKYVAAQAHSALSLRLDPQHITIPQRFKHCESPQSYVEAVAIEEQETRNFLKAALKCAKQLLHSIKEAVDDGSLEKEHLAVLKLKVLALQEHYPDAWRAIHGDMQDLFHPMKKYWWDAASLTSAHLHGYTAPAHEARAYDNAERLIPLLNFFVPVVCMVSCIPIGYAWMHSDSQSGSVDDPNFSQLVAGSILQLLSLATLVYPTVFHARLARASWLLTWTLGAASAAGTVSSIPMYLCLSTAWSMLVGFGGMVAQALILLQIVHAI